MAVEHEIARLATTFVADVMGFIMPVKQAQEAAQTFARETLSAVAKIKSAFAGGSFLGQAFEAFAGRESAMLRLTAALEANGREVGTTVAAYRAFADRIAETTVLSQGEVVTLLQRAEVMGRTGAAAQSLVRDSIALAKATNGEASSMMSMVAAAQEGNTERLRRIPGLRGVKDQTELVARAQQMMSVGMKVAAAEADSASGLVRRLGNAYRALTADIGEVVVAGMKPFIQSAIDSVKWFRELPSWTKNAVAGVAALTAGWIALSGAIALAGVIFNSKFAGIGIIIGAIVTGTAALAYWAAQTEGFGQKWKLVQETAGAAWQATKRYAMIFWSWIEPAWDRLMETGSGVWTEISDAAGVAWGEVMQYVNAFWEWAKPIAIASLGVISAAWDFAVEGMLGVWAMVKVGFGLAWNAMKVIGENFVGGLLLQFKLISGGAIQTWGDVKDYAVVALITAEFAMREFQRVCELAWVSIQFGAIANFERITFFFTDTLPAIGSWFAANWRALMNDWLEYNKTIFLNLGKNIGAAMDAIADMLRGKTVDWGEVWTPLGEGLKRTFGKLELPEFELSKLAADLRQRTKDLGGDVGADYQEFLRKRLLEIGAFKFPVPGAKEAKEAGKSGEEAGQQWTKGLVKELHKFDATQFASSEAFARIQHYVDVRADLISGKVDAAKLGGGGKSDAVTAGSPDALGKEDRQTKLLEQIRDVLKAEAGKPKVEVDPADLGG